jgi:hypothetical protein
MKLLTDNNKENIYMIIGDRIYNEPHPKNLNYVKDEMRWDIQNPEIQTIEDIYREFPWLKNFPEYSDLKLITTTLEALMEELILAFVELMAEDRRKAKLAASPQS